MTDQDVLNGLSAIEVYTLTLYGEARSTGPDGMRAVADSIANRVAANALRFGRGYRAVCLRPSQYSCWWAFGGKDNHAAVMAAGRTLLSGRDAMQPILKLCLEIAEAKSAGTLTDDTVFGATHYYNPDAMMPHGSRPSWATTDDGLTVEVGRRPRMHRFFVGV